MTDRYVIVRRNALDVPLYGTLDIAAALAERTRMVVADRGLRDVLVVMERAPHDAPAPPRQVYPRQRTEAAP